MPETTTTVPTKNPLASTAIWGLILMIVAAAVKKWAPPAFQEASYGAAVEALTFLVGAALNLYGRWQAHQPLSLTSSYKTVTLKT